MILFMNMTRYLETKWESVQHVISC